MLAAFATGTRRDHLLDAAVCSLTSSTTRPWNRRSLAAQTQSRVLEPHDFGPRALDAREFLTSGLPRDSPQSFQ